MVEQLDMFGPPIPIPTERVEVAADDRRLTMALSRLRANLHAIGHDPDDNKLTKLRYDRRAGTAVLAIKVSGKCYSMRTESHDVVLAIDEINEVVLDEVNTKP